MNLDAIIKEGQKINENNITPTVNEKLSIKVSILDILSNVNQDVFVMNRKLYQWKKQLELGEINLPDKVEQYNQFSENVSGWLLEPLLIFCQNPEELAKKIADGLFEKKYKYVRARNDMYPTRIIVDVEFEIVAIINPLNKTITKHLQNVELFGANVNMNGLLMLPILLYDYITPRFNYEQWKDNLEIEPFLWKNMKSMWEKNTSPIEVKQNKESSTIFELIKSEKEEDYIFTGFYTYHMLTKPNEKYKGQYNIYHKDPIEFLRRVKDTINNLKIKEEEITYYFQTLQYNILLDGEIILTVCKLEFPMNYIKLGYYNHLNYHGLLLFLLLDALKSPIKEYEEKCGNIGYLIKAKNIFCEKIGSNSVLNKNGKNGVKNVFAVLQNNMIGPHITPFLEFKMKEFNKELTFFYRPDKQV